MFQIIGFFIRFHCTGNAVACHRSFGHSGLSIRTLSFRSMAGYVRLLYNKSMKKNTRSSSLPWFSQLFNILKKSIGPVWPFFGILTASMVVMYAYTVYYSPVLHQSTGLLILFTVLMLVHTTLHWFSPYITTQPRYVGVYLVIQSIMVFTIVFTTKNESLVYGLYMAMIGESIGLIRPLRKALIAIAVFLTLSAVNFGLIKNWTNLGSWVFMVIPTAVFVVVYVILFVRQIEEKQCAEMLLAELEEANEKLKDYNQKIEELTLTTERQRVARELHDTLAQGLAGLILQLEAAGKHLNNGNVERTDAILQQTRAQARQTLAEARHVIDDLRAVQPPAVDFAVFLQAETKRFQDLTAIPCNSQIDADILLDERLSLQLQKIVTEGLGNIARHAGATHAWVNVKMQDGKIHLEIRDNGIGFDVDAKMNQPGHYGLIGMRERTRMLGGHFEISSQPGAGSSLNFLFPMAARLAKDTKND